MKQVDVHKSENNSGRGFSRRRLLRRGGALAGGVIGIAAGAACGPFDRQPQSGGKPQLVEWMDWGDPQAMLPWATVMDNFRAKNPNIQLDWLPTPPGYEDKMRAMVAAGTPADVHRVNDDFVRGFTVKGQLLDLAPYLKRSKIKSEDFFSSVYDFPIYQGKYWAWSTGNNPRLFFVNLSMFKNMGVQPPLFDKWDPPGWTWDDMIETARKLTQNFDDRDRAQFGVSIYDDTGYEETFLVNFGEEEGIYSKDANPQRWTMGTPRGIDALQQVIDLTCKQRVQRPHNFPTGGDALFQQGRIGMVFRTGGFANAVNRTVRDQFEWDVAPVPKRVKRITEGSLITYCVAKEAKNPDGAWDVLNYHTSDEGGQVYAEQRAFVPARKEVARKFFRARSGERPDRLFLVVEGNTVAKNVNFAAGTERARNIYRPEFNRRAYTCQESLKITADSVRSAVGEALALEA